MLEKLRYRDYGKGLNVEAYTDGYSYDRYYNLYLLSTSGRDSAVKAISSALISGEEVEILSDYPVSLQTGFSRKYRTLSSKLGSGLLHQIVVDDGFFRSSSTDGKELLLVDDEKNAHEIVYNAVERKYSVPMIPKWSKWLYRKMDEEDCIDRLHGTRKVLKLNASEEKLDSIISRGIRAKEIDF